MYTLTKCDAFTIQGIMGEVEAGTRKLKDIAADCRWYVMQTNSEYAASIYARFGDCKTRAQFKAVFESV